MSMYDDIFDKDGVVTHCENRLVVEIDHIFSEHFAASDIAEAFKLFADKADIALRCSHKLSLLNSVLRYNGIRRNERRPASSADLLENLIGFRTVKIKSRLMLGVHENTHSDKYREDEIGHEFTQYHIPCCNCGKAAIKQIEPCSAVGDLAAHYVKLILSEIFLQADEIVCLRVIVAVSLYVIVKSSAVLDKIAVSSDRNALSFRKLIDTDRQR